MDFKKQLKDLFDNTVDKGTDIQIENINKCVDMVFGYISQGYPQSRECIQYVINQLERVPRKALVILAYRAMDFIRNISRKFCTNKSPSLEYFNQDVNEQLFDRLLGKISPETSGELNITQLKPEIAEKLSLDERKKIVGYNVDSVQVLGLKTSWNSDIINFLAMMQAVMYSICKKDKIMDLFFNWNGNILDRLNTSSQCQSARDFAESLIIIGHQEGFIAEAYFDASRAYTGGGNALAGLLYLNISLLDLDNRTEVRQELAFNIVWQMLKIIRVVHINKQLFIDELLQIYEALNMDDYNTLSIYHTAFTIRVALDANAAAEKIENFLNKKREAIFKNMQHSAVPWYTLFKAIQLCGGSDDYPMIQHMKKLMRTEIIKNGNEKLVNLCENNGNQTHLLIEELVKLDSSRSPKDFGYASKKALLLAENVLENAVASENAEEYILAMRPKSDLSFTMLEKRQDDVFKKVDVVDPKGEKYKLPYVETDKLIWLLQAEHSDCIMWIGLGTSKVFRMTLLGCMYKFDELQALNTIDANKLQKEIFCKIKFIRTDSSGFPKDKTEIEKETEQIYTSVQACSLSVPNVVSRIFFVKDLKFAAIPHQLIIDERSNMFVGEICPTANIISTEFLIKSNFNAPLPKAFSKSYWSPLNKEVTFAIVRSSLKDLFEKYNFSVDDNDEPTQPLHADLNIICVHGSDNISETEWFYAGGAPLVNSDRVIGAGKVLVLFTCHSGSFTYQYFDNAMHTIVKRYLRMGYSSVIAPMWSLNIEILPIWLDTFMSVLNAGKYVVDAVYQANMKVKKQFISPAAWACLHLFGNPYTQIADEPILSVTED